MTHIMTESGFECDVNEAIAQDWRFAKAIAMADGTDESMKLKGYIKIIELLLGKEGEEKLMEHVKTDEGIVPLPEINKEVVSLIKNLRKEKEVKNS